MYNDIMSSTGIGEKSMEKKEKKIRNKQGQRRQRKKENYRKPHIHVRLVRTFLQKLGG